MKVFSPPNNHKLNKILFAAKLYNHSVEHVEVPFNHKNKQFQDAYPQSTLPALELQDGTFIFGTNSILLSLVPEQHKGSPFAEVLNSLTKRHKSINGYNSQKKI